MCVAAFLGLLLIPIVPLYTGQLPHLIAVGPPSLTNPYTISNPLSTWEGKKCALQEDSEVGKPIPILGCTLGNFDSANERVLVIGNSFSVAFVQAFDRLVSHDGNHHVVLGRGACQGDPLSRIIRRHQQLLLVRDCAESSKQT